jgi:hypothetical protein
MKAVTHVAVLCALLCTSLFMSVDAKEQSDSAVEVRKQTANSGSQTIMETPKTRKAESEQHLTDAMNTTRKQSRPAGPRDSYGVQVPEPIPGQRTNGSTETMRAADKKH